MSFKHLFLTTTFLLTLPFTASAQEHTIFRHGGSVETVAYSPINSFLLASGGNNRTVKLWDLKNDTVTTLGYHTDIVNTLAFSPDGQLLASGGDDYVFKLWDISRQQSVATLDHVNDWTRSQIKAVAFSPNGQLLATAGVHVKLWNVHTREELATLEHNGGVFAIDFSPDGQLLATGDGTGWLNVWDVQRRQIVIQFECDSTAVYAVKFSPDGELLTGAGYTGKAELRKIQGWERLGTLTANGTIHNMSFSPDSSILTATGYESVNLWEVDSGEKRATLSGHTGWVKTVAFSPDGGTLMSGGEDETLRMWDVTPYRSISQDMVRIIYFLPRDRSPQPDIWAKLDGLIREVQTFYADQMERNGFGRKTFTFETDENSETLVYRVDGQYRDWYYHTKTQEKVYTEIASQVDMEKHVYLIVVDLSTEFINEDHTCGVGGGHWFEGETVARTHGGYAIIPASGRCFDGQVGASVAAHELGHAFGLEHDFRNDAYIMSYGAAPDRLSRCAAGWLDASRLFNAVQTAFNEPTTLQLLTPSSYPPNAKNFALQFEVTDSDGIHQAQLLIPTTAEDPAPGVKLHSCQNGDMQNNRVEFYIPTLTAYRVNDIMLQVIDVHGNITRQAYTLRADDTLLFQKRVDVNRDGTVNVEDLVVVAASFGKVIPNDADPNPDVNRDGVVNVVDILLVIGQIDAVPAAPTLHTFTAADLRQWINQAKHLDISTHFSPFAADIMKEGIVVLEQFLATLVPTETMLLSNYPNPFNPETWLPYQLAAPADVMLSIYSADGELVRTLALGHRPAGVYHSKNRAAHWDGRNEYGETVASGVYFYTLTAGDFIATRKMLIRK